MMGKVNGRGIVVGAMLLLGVLLLGGVSFAQTDVTEKIQLNRSRMIYNRRAGTTSFDVSLTNISGDVLLTPIRVVIEDISDPNVSVSNPDGFTDEGEPYFEYRTDTGQFLGSETTGAKRWTFSNPYRRRFSYSFVVEATIPEAVGEIGPEGGTIEIENEDSPLRGAAIEVPVGSLSESQVVAVAPSKSKTRMSVWYKQAGPSIEVCPNGLTFESPIRLILPYKDQDNDGFLDGTGVPEEDVQVFYLDESEWKWKEVEARERDYDRNTITIETTHFSVYRTAYRCIALSEREKVIAYFENASDSEKILSGQFVGYAGSIESGYHEHLQGLEKIPVIIGADLGYGTISDEDIQTLVDHWNSGGLVVVSWHVESPWGGGVKPEPYDSDEKKEMFNELVAALYDDNIKPQVEVQWLASLDYAATQLSKLKLQGVSVIWRPFHEMNGNWFWWGGQDPAKFKKLWEHMYRYFTEEKGLDNLVWLYSPNIEQNGDVTRYLPNKGVDLLGIDYYDYPDEDWDEDALWSNFTQLKSLGTNMPVGFGEFGPCSPELLDNQSTARCGESCLKLLDLVNSKAPGMCFFQFWQCPWSLNCAEDGNKLLAEENVISLPKGFSGYKWRVSKGKNTGSLSVFFCGNVVSDPENDAITLHHTRPEGSYLGSELVSLESDLFGYGTYEAAITVPASDVKGIIAAFFLYYRDDNGKIFEVDFEMDPGNSKVYLGTYNNWTEGDSCNHVVEGKRDFYYEGSEDNPGVQVDKQWWGKEHRFRIEKHKSETVLMIDPGTNDELIWRTTKAPVDAVQHIVFNIWAPDPIDWNLGGQPPEGSDIKMTIHSVSFEPYEEGHPGSVPVFTPYSENPILSSYTISPRRIVKYDDNEYRMYFLEQVSSGNYPADFELDLMTSTDGLTWGGIQKNIIGRAQSGRTFNYYAAEIKQNGIYKVWHSATSDANIAGTKLYYSTSDGGVNFMGRGLVLDNGQYPEYDSRNINHPCVVYDGRVYHLYYSAYPGYQNGAPNYSFHYRIAYATSLDGVNWSKHGVVLDVGPQGSFDSRHVSSPVVIFDGDIFEMFYTGRSADSPRDRYAVGYAVSSDGLHWEKVGVVDSINIDAPRAGYVVGVIKENGIYKIWYLRRLEDWRKELYYAVGTKP